MVYNFSLFPVGIAEFNLGGSRGIEDNAFNEVLGIIQQGQTDRYDEALALLQSMDPLDPNYQHLEPRTIRNFQVC